jgi:hypothetical protein
VPNGHFLLMIQIQMIIAANAKMPRNREGCFISSCKRRTPLRASAQRRLKICKDYGSVTADARERVVLWYPSEV